MTIGERLKEERVRLGLSQPDFAALAQTTKKSQIDYEKGATHPNAAYLAAIAAAGADIQYVVTGERRGQGIGEPAIHQAVLDAIDLLSLDKAVDAAQLAKAVVKLAGRNVAPTTSDSHQVQQNFQGAVVHGHVAGRDAHIDNGSKK